MWIPHLSFDLGPKINVDLGASAPSGGGLRSTDAPQYSGDIRRCLVGATEWLAIRLGPLALYSGWRGRLHRFLSRLPRDEKMALNMNLIKG